MKDATEIKQDIDFMNMRLENLLNNIRSCQETISMFADRIFGGSIGRDGPGFSKTEEGSTLAKSTFYLLTLLEEAVIDLQKDVARF